MPPDPKQAPAPPDPPEPAPDSAADRLTAVEAEQKRQGGILEQILGRLPDAGSRRQNTSTNDPAPDGRPIAELVREGVEQLRREEQEQADRDAERAQREDHATRLAALEERQPSETAATPAGRIRSAVQKWGFGIDETRR